MNFKALINKYSFAWPILIVLTYFMVTFYYMTPVVMHCNTVTYGFGDNTAGPIWRAKLPQHQALLGSFTNMTNYPYGDNLYSPAAYSTLGQVAVITTAQRVFGPVCGYNLVNITSFVLSATVVFGFVYVLTRNKWLALLAGYAAAFSPYYQVKIGGHPSYGFQAIFVGIIWLFYNLLKKRRIQDAVYLALLLAFSFYFDPYFVLLSSLVIFPLGIAWLLFNLKIFKPSFWRQSKLGAETKQQLKMLAVSAGVAAILLVPLAGVYSISSKQINTFVTASRGNVLAEARSCTNWPHEYFIPFVLNPIFQKAVGKTHYVNAQNFLRSNFACGIGEDSVGLSLTLVTIAGLGFMAMGWERINKRRLGLAKILSFEPKTLILGVALVGLAAAAVGFPPLKLHHIPTPSEVLLSLTTTWRTLTRVYVLVNLSLVILASVALAYFAKHFAGRRKLLIIAYVIIFAGVFIEYQAFVPFKGNTLSTFNYNTQVPAIYNWVKNQADIKVVAEYPLEREGGESNAGSYYLTMQSITGKKLFNSASAVSPQEVLRSGLKDLSDPQTLPVLSALGVDAVIVHGVPLTQIQAMPYANVVYSAPQSQFNLLTYTPTIDKTDNVAVMSLKNVPKAQFVIMLGTGFVRNATIIHSSADWQYEAVQNSVMNVAAINNGRTDINTVPRQICFDAKMSIPAEHDNLWLIADGQKIDAGPIDGQYRQYSVSAIREVTLENGSGHNMRVQNLGCQ